MTELILEVARATTWPSSQALRLGSDKTQGPALICLDMKDWVTLAQAHYGLTNDEGVHLALSRLRTAVQEGRVVTPVTSANIIEVSEISQPDRRARLAEFMVGLSRNHALVDFLAVRTRELYDAVSAQYLGRKPNERESARVQMLRWGIANAAGVGGVRVDGAPQELEDLMNETLKLPLVSTRALARIWNAEDTASGKVMDERWRAAEEVARNELHGLSEGEVWKRESWHSLMEGEGRRRLQEVAGLLEIDWNYLKAWLWDDENLINLMRAVPSLSIDVRLRHARARNPHHRTHPNDLKDLIFLCATLPYANIIVTDKAWAHVATQARLDVEFGTQICRSVAELPRALDALPTG